MSEIIPAAYYGRVEKLFAKRRAHIRGEFDTETGEISITEDSPDDLIDLAVTQTYLHRGEVLAVDEEVMPTAGDLAALLRY